MRPYCTVLAVLLALIFLGLCTVSTLSAQPAQITIEPTIPNLTGTWNVESVGSVMLKSSLPGEWTHRKDRYSNITGQAVVTDQQGRVLHGMFAAPLGKNESFIAVIGMDNTSLYLADQDGFMDLKIINDDLMTGVYRQVTENDIVVAEGTWTRVR
jgi:hypothetical protein